MQYLLQNSIGFVMQSIEDKIKSRIYGNGRGWVFTPNHFFDLGSREAVAIALLRLSESGMIRSLARGLYDYPEMHNVMGKLHPSVNAIAKALVGNAKLRLQPSGAYAANLLGLSEQVPMKIVFLTDGASKTIRIGNQEIILKRTTPKSMSAAGRLSGLIIQALKYFGKTNIDSEIIDKLSARLSSDDKTQLMKDIPLAPVWIGAIMKKIAKSE